MTPAMVSSLQYHWYIHCADKYCGSFSPWISTDKNKRWGVGETEREIPRLIIALAWDRDSKTHLIAL